MLGTSNSRFVKNKIGLIKKSVSSDSTSVVSNSIFGRFDYGCPWFEMIFLVHIIKLEIGISKTNFTNLAKQLSWSFLGQSTPEHSP